MWRKDWETGIFTAISSTQGQEWSKSDVLLAFSAIESDLQTKNPTALYSDILARAYDELSRRRASTRRGRLDAAATNRAIISGSSDPESEAEMHSRAEPSPEISSDQTQHSPAAAIFANSLAEWPIFPDTPAALARLSALGLKLAVLSNVDRVSFAHTRAVLERRGGFAFGAVYTAEDIGSYNYLSSPPSFVYRSLADYLRTCIQAGPTQFRVCGSATAYRRPDARARANSCCRTVAPT